MRAAKQRRWTPLKCPRARDTPSRSLFLAGFTADESPLAGSSFSFFFSFFFFLSSPTEMKSKNAGGGPVNGAKVGQPSGRESKEGRGRRNQRGDVNRNGNDYGRSYRGASFLNDYVLENYYA